MTTEKVNAPARNLSLLLLFGVIFLPIIFAWFTLRPGYGNTTRAISMGWMVIFALMAMGTGSPDDAKTDAPATPAVAKTPEQIAEENAARIQAGYRDAPALALELESVGGQKGGFGTVLILRGTIKNDADFAIKDMEITCDLYGASGTRVGVVRQTLFDVVPANGEKRFTGLNMGLMGSSQVVRHGCTIVDAVAG